ncbi:MAG TPA: diguanylate cyclase [Rubrivivax sp.]|nr:diguanylate cyclase [Rubrivivax sp.]
MSRVLLQCLAWTALLLAVAASAIAASPDEGLLAEVMAARMDSGMNPRRGLATLRALRERTSSSLQVRLAVDEAACRVLTDIDASAALAVADAGLALAGPDPESAARVAWLRLRACRAGMLVETGQVKLALAEFEALLDPNRAPSDIGTRALAMLERGVHRSRSGHWDQAQTDLLTACAQLKSEGPARDHELCLGHLANHYQRVGDVDEALRILQTLKAAAQERGAHFDRAVYGFGIGQAQQALQQWTDALSSFEQAADDSRRLGDGTGLAYAERGMAGSQLRLNRPREALAHSERALLHLSRAADARQYESIVISRAEALAALGRAAEANAALEGIEGSVRQRGEQPSLADLLSVRASALSQLGRWREAYQALTEAHTLQDRLQGQRLSQQSARLRMQFNRLRDAEDLSTLRQLNEQGQRLRQTQAVALVLFVVLLLAVLGVAVRKFRQAGHLQSLASTDELTGLANRRALMAFADDAVVHCRRDARPLALLMIDIDHFKLINDRHGHPVGDQVLRQVAGVLTSALRGRGDHLGRLGGEEFVAVLPGAGLGDAQQVAERMRRAIEATVQTVPGEPLRYTVSIGVACARAGESTGELLARADAALYRAKNHGRNAVVMDDGGGAPTSAA